MARRGPLLRATAAALLLGAAALFSTCMGDTPGPAADPGVLRQALELCGSAADCADDGDPCTEALCAGGECRHLPVFEGCCTGVEDCIPASPCLLAQCVLGETVGSCQDVPDPMKPGCCSTEADCPAPPVGEIYLCAKEEGALFKTCVATVDPNLCQPLSGAGVVINEFMNNPEAHDDTTGEWIELYNTSLTPVNLHGWVLADEGADNHVIQAGGGLVVPGGGYLLLARSNNPQANGGLDVDYVYYNYILSNGADEIILRNPQGVQMDRVEFGGTFAMVPGASMQLANPSLDNNSPVNWFPASLPWGAGSDRGTPGAPNTDGFFLYFTSPVCDDDNPCTLDTCGQGGAPLCRHDSIFDCCLFPVDCNDHDVCTLDVCQPQSLTCSHQPLPGCCNGDSQCADGNPCTLDLCGNHVCHNPVNPETPGCCISDAGCVDVNPCTIDFCKQEPLNPYKTCHHSSPGGKQCCLVDQDCVDELPETIDTCTGFQCQHAVDPEYCLAGPPQYCDDGDPCTQDQCDLVSHLCLHTPVPEC
ncbi:MAG: lamin tail domain-containing protein, partial [Deltaproteobacteria bacterium]|nr:lamin tail domain-containing protein [Deltaproteobacteria bacterium]